MLPRNKLQKINMRVMTSQYETSGKNNTHLLSHNVPAGECSNDFGYSVVLIFRSYRHLIFPIII